MKKIKAKNVNAIVIALTVLYAILALLGGFIYGTEKVNIVGLIINIIRAAAIIVFCLKTKDVPNRNVRWLFVGLFTINAVVTIKDSMSSVQMNNDYFLTNLLFTFLIFLVSFLPYLVTSFKCNKVFAIVVTVYYVCIMVLNLCTSIADLRYYTEPMMGIVSLLFGLLMNLIIFILWYVNVAHEYIIMKKQPATHSYKKPITLTEDDLESLKAKYDAGFITADEYNNKKAEIMSRL